MKKFALATVAAAAALTFGVANAYTMGTFKNGFVVPNVIHNGPTDTTAVGLVKIGAAVGAVRWTFFDQDSGHVRDGCFVMTENDYHPFVWSNPTYSGIGLDGDRGYLVFALSNAALCSDAASHDLYAGAAAGLAGHAFQVNTTNNDVAYTPVIDGNLTLAAGTDLASMNAGSLTAVAGAAQVVGTIAGAGGTNADLYMRYYLEGGASTRIVVWSTGDQKKTHTVFPYNDKQDSFSGNFKLDHTELDWFDPAGIPGWDPTFVDGFIKWTVTPASLSIPDVAVAPANTASIFSYSVINAPAFGAVQTVLGFHNP